MFAVFFLLFAFPSGSWCSLVNTPRQNGEIAGSVEKKLSLKGSWCSLVNTSACQAEDRGSKSRRPRCTKSHIKCIVALFFLGITAMHFVYVLQSDKTGKFYIGQTANLDDRLARHNDGRVPSTKAGKPWKLVRLENYSTRAEAIGRERELKSWRSHQRIALLINQPATG